MADVRTDARDVRTEILETDRDCVHPAGVGRKNTARIEQALLNLMIRREADIKVRIQAPRPKGDDVSQRLSRETRSDAEAEGGHQSIIIGGRLTTILRRTLNRMGIYDSCRVVAGE